MAVAATQAAAKLDSIIPGAGGAVSGLLGSLGGVLGGGGGGDGTSGEWACGALLRSIRRTPEVCCANDSASTTHSAACGAVSLWRVR